MNNNSNNNLKPKGWDEVTVTEWKEREFLPTGGYVCRIIKARKEPTNGGGEQLICAFDIFEGEQKDFFKRDYANQPEGEGKKWRGTFRIFLPNESDYGTERHKKAMKNYKGFITSVEKSNNGFSYNFIHSTLVNKLVGFIFGEEEWEWNGKTGVSVKPRFVRSVETIRSGKFTVPPIKELPKQQNTTFNTTDTTNDKPFTATTVEDMDDLPF